MPGLNRWEGVGYLGSDPVLKNIGNDRHAVNIRMGCTRPWKNPQTDAYESDWVNLVFFGSVAERVAALTVKGALLYVAGRLQTRSWDGADGTKQYMTEVVVSNNADMQMLVAGKPATKPAVTKTPVIPSVGSEVPF